MGKSKFGFDKVEVVTAAILRQRIKYLEAAIASGRWDRNREKRFNAGKLAAQYRYQLTHDPRFAAKRTSKKAA